jgi:hypothetical protein
MRGRLWLKYFIYSLKEKEKTDYPRNPNRDAEWTEFMYKIIDGVADKLNCWPARRRQENIHESGEYLNIDAVFIDNAEYESTKEDRRWDPFVLPRAVVELENSYDLKKISYCLWKILCIRAAIRVLICYQSDIDKVKFLKKRLEDVIWQGSLVKGSDGDLLVIVGDDSRDEDSQWEDYFTMFEWRNDRLERIKGVEW